MPLDLGRLQGGQNTRLINPRDIFAALPTRNFGRLRLEQGEVLNKWFERRHERDLVIKQNTGGGKTVVGLLVAQSSINEEVGPVAYLVPDKYLVQQVVDEATAIGVGTTTDARDFDFRAGTKVLVATFEKVVNGKSVFGIRGNPSPIILGTVVIDDAHAAIPRIQDQFRVRVNAPSQGGDSTCAYSSLLSLFRSDLQSQNMTALHQLEEGRDGPPIRVPFWTWTTHQEEILSILAPLQDDDSASNLKWSWPLISPHLQISSATFTNKMLEIRLPCPAIDMIPAFDQARRRVYLTATLADDGVLVTELGADPRTVRTPVTPNRAADLGDRLILAPRAVNPQLDDDTIRSMIRTFANGDWDGDGIAERKPLNVVVLVPSDWGAENWKQYSDQTLHVSNMKPVVEQLQREHVGLVVLVNKYDGVDLPQSACRLLIVDGVPSPLAPSEMRESAALSGSATYQARVIQRIEQGMGRGIRDAEDYCAVLLLGDEIALTQVKTSSLQMFSPATQAQIKLSQKIAEQIRGEGVTSIRQALSAFLLRDPGWLGPSRSATSVVEYSQDGHVSEMAKVRREAFTTANTGKFREAANSLRSTANSLTDDREKGWILEEAATYLHQVDPAEAQEVQAAAKSLNSALLIPAVPPPYKPLRANTAQALASHEYICQTYESGTALSLGIGAVFNRIMWNSSKTQQCEAAICDLGKHLGFISSRPDQDKNEGPDNLWIMTDAHHAVIELKTGISREDLRIKKTEAGQLSTSINWDEREYPDVSTRTPVLIHPCSECLPDAALPSKTRVMTQAELQSLRDDVTGFVNDLLVLDGWKDVDRVKRSLQEHNLTPSTIIDKHSTTPVTSTR